MRPRTVAQRNRRARASTSRTTAETWIMGMLAVAVMRFQGPGQLEAVDIRQIHVQKNQIHIAIRKGRERFLPGTSFNHRESRRHKRAGGGVTLHLVVVHVQNANLFQGQKDSLQHAGDGSRDRKTSTARPRHSNQLIEMAGQCWMSHIHDACRITFGRPRRFCYCCKIATTSRRSSPAPVLTQRCLVPRTECACWFGPCVDSRAVVRLAPEPVEDT